MLALASCPSLLVGATTSAQTQVYRESNLFIYQARESSLVPVGFLTAQFLQKLKFMKPLF